MELADIVRAHAAAFGARHRLSAVQHRALRAIQACRTPVLGGHLEQCDACGHRRYNYHSCRNRHCPKCQTRAKERWLEARRRELLPVPYFHLVFTLPHELNALAQGNPSLLYGLLFEAASDTLLEFGANPRWLGGTIGVTLILHTWGQTLSQHLHVHALVTGGALSEDGTWHAARRGFLFPVEALSEVFRGKYLGALAQAFERGRLRLAGSTEGLADPRARQVFFDRLRAHSWVVYAKAPLGGPEAVLEYLGRYAHRVALSNERLVSMSADAVRFRYKDYAHGGRRRVMALDAQEFIRRFLLHILPRNFVRIRHYGLLGNRTKQQALVQCRAALEQPAAEPSPQLKESLAAFWLRVAAIDIAQCTHCGQGRMRVVELLRAPHLPSRGPPNTNASLASASSSRD